MATRVQFASYAVAQCRALPLASPRPALVSRRGTLQCRAQATVCDSLVEKKCTPCEDDNGSLDQMGLCLAMDRARADRLCQEVRRLALGPAFQCAVIRDRCAGSRSITCIASDWHQCPPSALPTAMRGSFCPHTFQILYPQHHKQALTGWKVVEDEHGFLILERLYRTGSFLKALELCDRVAEVAEAEGHHPDIHLTGWNRLKLRLQTHSRRGLTEVIVYEDWSCRCGRCWASSCACLVKRVHMVECWA